MTAPRPTPTQGAPRPEAARVPRVSDGSLESALSCNALHGRGNTYEQKCLLDLRDERREHADARATIDGYVSRLTDTSERLLEEIARSDERARIDRDVISAAIEQKLATTARADALQARLTEAEQRAATAEKERDELREALRPFADEWNDSWCPEANAGFRVSDDETLTGGGGCSLTAGDLSRAARAMEKKVAA